MREATIACARSDHIEASSRWGFALDVRALRLDVRRSSARRAAPARSRRECKGCTLPPWSTSPPAASLRLICVTRPPTPHTPCVGTTAACAVMPRRLVSLRMYAPGPVAHAVGTGPFCAHRCGGILDQSRHSYTKRDLGAVEREHKCTKPALAVTRPARKITHNYDSGRTTTVLPVRALARWTTAACDTSPDAFRPIVRTGAPREKLCVRDVHRSSTLPSRHAFTPRSPAPRLSEWRDAAPTPNTAPTDREAGRGSPQSQCELTRHAQGPQASGY